MQESSPPRQPILAGFIVCCVFYIILIAAVGFYGLRMQERLAAEQADCRDIESSVEQARRLFTVMQFHSARRAITQDLHLGEQIREVTAEMAKTLDGVASTMRTPENRRRMEVVFEMARRYADFDQGSEDLLRKRQELTALRLASEAELLAALQELILLWDASMQKTAFVQEDGTRFLREPSVQYQQIVLDTQNSIERRRRVLGEMMRAVGPKEREILLKKLIDSFDVTAKQFHDLRASVTAQEAREGIEKALHCCDENRVICDEIANTLAQADRIEAEKDQIVDETTKLFEEITMGLVERNRDVSEMTDMTNRRLTIILLITSTVSAVFCLIMGVFVATRTGRPTSRSDTYDAYAPTDVPRDLTVVADKLQEVVDLLRR